MKVSHRRLFAAFSLACALLGTGRLCAQEEAGGAAGTGTSQCRECGVVTGIRELQHERESARTLTERLPPVVTSRPVPVARPCATVKAGWTSMLGPGMVRPS